MLENKIYSIPNPNVWQFVEVSLLCQTLKNVKFKHISVVLHSIMNEVQAEHEYLESLRNLFERATAAGISAEEFHQLVGDSLNQIENYRPTSRWKIFRKKKFVIMIVILLLCIINCITNEKPVSLFLCKIQEFIYPGLKLLRIVSIPIISFFPSLTGIRNEIFIICIFFINTDCYNFRVVWWNVFNSKSIFSSQRYELLALLWSKRNIRNHSNGRAFSTTNIPTVHI